MFKIIIIALAVLGLLSLLKRRRRTETRRGSQPHSGHFCRRCEHPYEAPDIPSRCRRCGGSVDRR
ncbi:MAG: hypothetical protein KC777_11085 [Cyanobacteria bacterium HKST-UBA02]|nr:hypothetical protein [Cyanobacteria bacterium HKST-UBA02]